MFIMLNTINDDNISLKSLEDSYCSVCLSSLINDISKLSCNHSFHEKCINEWLKVKDTCPLCRFSIIRPNMDVLPRINTNIPRTNNKPIIGILCFIFILINFCSNFYLDYNISGPIYHTNYLLIQNQTLPIIKSNNYNGTSFLYILDINYLVIFSYAATHLIIRNRINLCSVAIISILYILNIGIHQIYISNIFKKLDNDIYEFSYKNKYNFILSVILYSLSLFLKTVLLIIHVKINNN